MRACEGCRRRKIKCDAATTNTWPCSACTRLKLHCVPPTISQERDFAAGQLDDYESGQEYIPTTEEGLGNSQSRLAVQQSHEGTAYHHVDPNVQYENNLGTYTSVPYSNALQDHHHMYQTAPPTHISPTTSYQGQHALFPSPPGQQPSQLSVSVPYSEHNDTSAEDLGEAFGDLNIGVDGVGKFLTLCSCGILLIFDLAPYIRQQKKNNSEPAAPMQDEYEVRLPPLTTGRGSHVRIPPELMPSHEDSMHYFDVFFNDVHPYVPVVNRSYFFRQWQTDRSTISPLLLEAIFACAGRMSDEPAQGAQWLALASSGLPSGNLC